MVVYITKNHRYEVEELGEERIIKSKTGLYEGEPFRILGFHDSLRHETLLVQSYTISELRELVDQEARIGKKIVAVHVDEDGEEIIGSGGWLVTSEIIEIK